MCMAVGTSALYKKFKGRAGPILGKSVRNSDIKCCNFVPFVKLPELITLLYHQY